MVNKRLFSEDQKLITGCWGEPRDSELVRIAFDEHRQDKKHSDRLDTAIPPLRLSQSSPGGTAWTICRQNGAVVIAQVTTVHVGKIQPSVDEV